MKRTLLIVCICAVLAIPITLFRSTTERKVNNAIESSQRSELKAKQAQEQADLKAKQLEEVKKQNEELNKQLQTKATEKSRLASITNQHVSAGSVAAVITGDKSTWLAASGIPQSDWGYVDYIISHESSWRPDARNSGGCLGLAQACPGTKILAVCPTLDPVCQLQWANAYAARYKGWAGAYSFWLANKWW